MSALLKPRAIAGLTLDEIDDACAAAMRDHELRLDVCETIPLVRTGRPPYRRPRTAIISEAAKRKLNKRLAAERFAALVSRFHARVSK